MAYRLAQRLDGRFLLRFEDIDHTRVREEYYQGIEEDLKWLGLPWSDPPIRQSARLSLYRAALDHLRSLDVLYPCFCTRRQINEEIARMGQAPHGPEGPLYPGPCRPLSEDERQARLAQGDTHCWRLDVAEASNQAGPLTFYDAALGLQPVDPLLLGDIVLARKDIATSYHLAVVVDDAAQEITHVTRGEDLLASTHVHRLLQRLLDLPSPSYFHHRLVRDENGERLATRNSALSVDTLRHDGLAAEDLLQLLPTFAQLDTLNFDPAP